MAEALGNFKNTVLGRSLDLNLTIIDSITEEEVKAASNKHIQYGTKAKDKEELQLRFRTLMLTQIKNSMSIGEDFNSIITEIKKELTDKKKLLTETNSEEQKNADVVFLLQAVLNAMDAMTSYVPYKDFQDLTRETIQGSFEGIGVSITKEKKKKGIVVKQIFKGGPSYSILLPEDIIIEIQDQKGVHDLRDLDINDAVERIRGPRGSIIQVTVQREFKGTPKLVTLSITRNKVYFAESIDVELLSKEGKNIVYIKFNEFVPKTAYFIEKKVKDVALKNKIDGVIIDLSNNGGGLLQEAVNVADLFSDTGIVVYAKTVDRISKLNATITGELFNDVPMLVNINEYSASASEILAGYLQDLNRAIIIGSEKSFGKGTIQTIEDPKKYRPTVNFDKHIGGLKITMGKFFTPSGKTPQEKGISSDVVMPTLVPEKHVMNNDLLFTASYEELESISPYKKYSFGYEKIMQKLIQNSTLRVKNSSLLQQIDTDPDSILRQELVGQEKAQRALKEEALNIMLDTIKLLKKM